MIKIILTGIVLLLLSLPSYADSVSGPVMVPIYASAVNLPPTGNTIGALGVTIDTNTLYVWDGVAWLAIGTPGAAIALDGLIGDATATGPGTAIITFATVNADVGSFGSASLIPSVTVNGKGLVTAVSTNAVIAPAGTLSGTTLNSTVVNSSLTSVGTVTSGTWNGTLTAGSSFITSGTTYTTPANISSNTQFKFTLIGGGGGGGGFAAAGESASGGGGGGGGIVWVTGLSPSTGYTIAIGAAGTGGIATTPGNAGSGGNTTLTIGATTYTARGGAGSGGGSSNNNGGAGGTTSNFTIGVTGQQGNGATAAAAALGSGGNSPFGLGLGGPALGVGGVGLAGSGCGAGGGGAHGSANTGGPGTAGCIIVEWQN